MPAQTPLHLQIRWQRRKACWWVLAQVAFDSLLAALHLVLCADRQEGRVLYLSAHLLPILIWDGLLVACMYRGEEKSALGLSRRENSVF